MSAVASNKSPGVDLVFSGGTNGKLYKCHFGTGTGTTPTEVTAFTNISGRATDTIRTIRIDPVTPVKVWVATDRTVYYSSDSGNSWGVNAVSNMPDARMYSLVVNSQKDSTIIAGSRGYVYRTTDLGATWSADTGGWTRRLPATSLAPYGANVWAVSNELSYVNSTTNSGSSWSGIHLSPLTDIFFGLHVNELKTASGAKYVIASGTRDYNNSNTSALYLSTDGRTT